MSQAAEMSESEQPVEPDAPASEPERPRRLGEIPVNPPRRVGPRREEAKPWEAYNSDGTPNPGSYAAGAAADAVQLAHKLASLRMREVHEAGGDETITLAQVQHLAHMLLRAADAVQASMRADGRHDRMDTSYRRAQSFTAESLWMFPVPWGADQSAREEWHAALTEHAGLLARMARSLFVADQ